MQLYSTINQFEKNHCFGVFAFYSIGKRGFKMCRNSFSGMEWREVEGSNALNIKIHEKVLYHSFMYQTIKNVILSINLYFFKDIFVNEFQKNDFHKL